jgi:formylglycine-generating enzyme required for sulfatase activity
MVVSCRTTPEPPAASSVEERSEAVARADPESGTDAPEIRTFEVDRVRLEGGSFERDGYPTEVDAFSIDRYEVTNQDFARFVAATGYVTEAERWGWALVFHPDADPTGEEARVPETPWWLKVDGAEWRKPRGDLPAVDRHPVVQVSWNDAAAFCSWTGGRLPSEAEWEFAARGGSSGTAFGWGHELAPEGRYRANTWQGDFPLKDETEDGFDYLAPVGSFEANGYGLYDMSGNVWEWCSDWYLPGYFELAEKKNPKGPTTGHERVLRGGSWLCSANYCEGYRLDQRNHSAPDSGLDNTGFRCAADLL